MVKHNFINFFNSIYSVIKRFLDKLYLKRQTLKGNLRFEKIFEWPVFKKDILINLDLDQTSEKTEFNLLNNQTFSFSFCFLKKYFFLGNKKVFKFFVVFNYVFFNFILISTRFQKKSNNRNKIIKT